ncbi:Glycosyl hydrolase catalytic core domain containing protein [Rhypophila decipiens]
MRSITTLLAPALLWLPSSLADSDTASTRNLKRGIAFTPNENWPDDDRYWAEAAEKGAVSWYYNFGWQASAAYQSVPQSTFEFVPMMWGAGTANGTDSYFAGNISDVIDKGRAISHVMTFSHPDGTAEDGGPVIKPRIAARSWVNNAVPLQQKGVKVGLPIVGDPYNWVTPFLANCSDILNKTAGKKDGEAKPECKFDFIPITSYGDMAVLEDRVATFANAFPGVPIWLIEYGFNDQDLPKTQKFFNESLAFVEASKSVERYAWFGACRSIVSNVGPNAAMLNPYGELTDIGSWYLGGNATGLEAIPTDQPTEAACTPEKPCGSGPKNGASGARIDGLVMSLLAVGAVFVLFF